jgi:flagellar hook assembly protein FlgD
VSLAGAPDAHVRLRIFDVRGRLVSQLYEGRLGNAGDMVWDGRDGDGRRVSSGIYFVNAETSSASVSNKVIFVR